MTDGQQPAQQETSMTPEQRAQADATLLGQFNDSVRQSQEMLAKNGSPADKARDIAFARSLLFLPAWHVVACIVMEDGKPQPKRLAMIEVRDAQGQPCPSLAVFTTLTLAALEMPRMQIPIEGGSWAALSIPLESVIDWVDSMKIPAVSVVTQNGTMTPACVLGLDFLKWVATVEAESRKKVMGA